MIAKPEPVGTIRRVNSRNQIREAPALKTCRNPPIVCVWRHYDKPIPKWKADLHAFALSFLPAVVAFIVTLLASGAIGITFWISMGLYVFTFGTVVFIKGFSKEVDVKAARNKVGISLFILVVVAFLLAAVGKVLETLSDDPVIQGLVALIAAAVTAIISQKFLALDPKYLAEAKKSPPLFSDREKTVWKIAAAVYGVLVVAALPRLLPENILNMLRQMIKLGIEVIKLGIEAIRSNIPCAIGILLAGGAILAGVILALFYWRFKLLKLFERLKRSWLFR